MREIEFRGIRIDNGEWIYGDLIQYGKYKSIKFIDEEYKKYEYPVIPESVGQFTGLLDKNGKKIFEGDVVIADWHWYDGKVVDLSYNGYFMYGVQEYFLEDVLEIIGNVHENPELLKQQI